MTEDQLVATQAAMRASDPRGKFYGKIMSLYISYHFSHSCIHIYRMPKRSQVLRWRCK